MGPSRTAGRAPSSCRRSVRYEVASTRKCALPMAWAACGAHVPAVARSRGAAKSRHGDMRGRRVVWAPCHEGGILAAGLHSCTSVEAGAVERIAPRAAAHLGLPTLRNASVSRGGAAQLRCGRRFGAQASRTKNPTRPRLRPERKTEGVSKRGTG